MSGVHFCVLLHGIDSPFGSADDMQTIGKRLRDEAGACRQRLFLVLESRTNSGRTSDGILCCGRRLVDEMLAFLSAQLGGLRPVRVYLSFVGHSLGGLIARAAIGWLERAGLFASSSVSPLSSSLALDEQLRRWQEHGAGLRFEPVSYVSVATPHLGARRPGVLHWLVKRLLCSYWLGPTLHELMLEDHRTADDGLLLRGCRSLVQALGPPCASADRALLAECSGGDAAPLLWLMAEPASVFVAGLRRFADRTLVSAARHDWQVPYCSSALSHVNPHSRPPRTPMSGRLVLVAGFERCAPERVANILRAAAPSAVPSLLRELPADVRRPSAVPAARYSPDELRTSDDYYLHDGCYHPTMLLALDDLHWRRVDFAFAEFFAHDLLVAKPSVPGYNIARGVVSSNIVATIVADDHRCLAGEQQHVCRL